MKLTGQEIQKLREVLPKLEASFLRDYGLKNINGGCVEIDMVGFDEDIIYLQCVSGIDGEDQRSIEDLDMDRDTFELIN